MRVRWSGPAVDDIGRHVAYLDEFNPAAGNRLAQRLFAAGQRLATFPRRGRARPDGTRELTVVYPYVLVYRVEEGVVVILRVWHGAQERGPVGMEEDALEEYQA